VSDPQKHLLPTFVAWASNQQRLLLERGSACVTSLKVDRATDNRAVCFTVEVFEVEASGWTGNSLQQGGDLCVWENGCADAEWATPADLNAAKFEASYSEHWDELKPEHIETAFGRFVAKYEAL
jgi:hypothetical protein